MPKTEVMVRVLYPTAFNGIADVDGKETVRVSSAAAQALIAVGYAEAVEEEKPEPKKVAK